MKQYLHRHIISILIALALCSTAEAQNTFPDNEGETAQYSTYIQMSNAYISGICLLLKENGVIKGSVFNEFGLTAIDFSYNIKKNKVKLIYVFDMMNKWYIKKTLKKDLANLLTALKKGETQYVNSKRHITYTFKPMEE